jgi:hypothetical protein
MIHRPDMETWYRRPVAHVLIKDEAIKMHSPSSTVEDIHREPQKVTTLSGCFQFAERTMHLYSYLCETFLYMESTHDVIRVCRFLATDIDGYL